MKTTILFSLITASALLAAPEPSFVWQGKTIFAWQVKRVDETRVRLPDGAVIPLTSVPPLLRGAIPANAGHAIANEVLQVLPDGLLLKVSTRYAGAGAAWEELREPIFLRGYPEAGKVVDGSFIRCRSEPDGRYTYTAVTGAARTVAAYRWTGDFVEPVKASTFGSALDRR